VQACRRQIAVCPRAGSVVRPDSGPGPRSFSPKSTPREEDSMDPTHELTHDTWTECFDAASRHPGDPQPEKSAGRSILTTVRTPSRSSTAILIGANSTAAQLRGGDRGDVRQHLRRGQGRDGLLLHVVECCASRRARPLRERQGRRDPVRTRYAAGSLLWRAQPGGRCTFGLASTRYTPASRHGMPSCSEPGRRVPDPCHQGFSLALSAGWLVAMIGAVCLGRLELS
jgi:hypothetical protein